jgi:hypothetical protein
MSIGAIPSISRALTLAVTSVSGIEGQWLLKGPALADTILIANTELGAVR